jgi:predicted nucleic acid-binding protein
MDASALIPLFVPDALDQKANALIVRQTDPLLVSDYADLEFSSSVMRMARAGVLSSRDAQEAIAEFSAWADANCERAEAGAQDIAAAVSLVRRSDIALRASDAVHVAIARRLGASLLTFDKKLAGNARRLGLAIA